MTARSDLPLRGLGIDAGGTATRWAVADAEGRVVAQGSVDGLTALLMGNETGRAQVQATVRQLAAALSQAGLAPQQVLAGFTGYSDDPPLRARLETLLADAVGLPASGVRVMGDIALAYLDSFPPGAGYLVYAGTGSIAAYIDADGQMHRAGGRGSLLDDGGSGYWIAREAMRHIWRTEDESPGSWRTAPLALAVFDRIGSSAWSRSRDFFYQSARGQVGELAVVVAAAAEQGDATAQGILERAGMELARLAQALERRFGPRPVALAGGALRLHAAIEASLRSTLGADATVRVASLRAHETAARLAARRDPVLQRFTDADPEPGGP